MKCPHCKTEYPADRSRCPRCGEDNPEGSGLFRSSTVLISQGKADLLYRSVEDVPPGLRTRLVQSTSGRNSATILIADRRGRDEIAKALRKLPGSAQRKLARSLVAEELTGGPAWLTPGRRKILAAVLLTLTLLVTALVFANR